MSKVALIWRTNTSQFYLFGWVFEWKKKAWEYRDATRTTIAIIRPQRIQEGIAFKLLGYDKTTKNTEGDYEQSLSD